jgi:phospholipase/carboxylesterase
VNLLHAAHVPVGDGPFPTVLALHGWGASAHDLLGLAPLLYDGHALVLCPQGPVEVPIAPGMHGYGWFPITGGGPPDPEEFERAATSLRIFLDAALERYAVDPRKLVVLGFSQGGVMAYDLALRDPSRFAGLAALSSWLTASLASELPKLPEHAGFPVLVMHGTEDPMIDIARARESRESLMPLGVALTYREYAMGHAIEPEAARDLVTWLRDKVISPIQLV